MYLSRAPQPGGNPISTDKMSVVTLFHVPQSESGIGAAGERNPQSGSPSLGDLYLGNLIGVALGLILKSVKLILGGNIKDTISDDRGGINRRVQIGLT